MGVYYSKFVLFVIFHIEHADCDAGSYGIRLYLTVGNNSDMFDSFLKLGYLRLNFSLLVFSLIIFTVFDGYSKADGLETAVRVMSPDIIIFDEAGSQDEFRYMEHAMNCGIRICASMHASSIEEIKHRIPFWKSFDHIVILGKFPNWEHRIYRTDEL